MRLSIVMPVYNEGEVIAKTINGVEAAVKVPHELLIVYDMDEDSTVPPVKKLQKKYHLAIPIDHHSATRYAKICSVFIAFSHSTSLHMRSPHFSMAYLGCCLDS